MTAIVLFKMGLCHLEDISEALNAYTYVSKLMDKIEAPLHPGVIMLMLRVMGRTMSDELLQRWLKKVSNKLERTSVDDQDPLKCFEQKDKRKYTSLSKNNQSIKSVIDEKEKVKFVRLGDSSYQSEALEALKESNNVPSKYIDKEVAQLLNSDIKLLPHEFLHLVVNSQDRLNVIKESNDGYHINKDKKKLKFFEDEDENMGINIFPLRNDERINKSPYRMMKKHLDKELNGKSLKFTSNRPSKNKAALSKEILINPNFEVGGKHKSTNDDVRHLHISSNEDNVLDLSTAMNLMYTLSK
jgi:hypothetical protein